jgi:hypothetical protein
LHICLSSGSSEQYRADVLRALILPPRTVLQFRYQDGIIDPLILSALQNGTFKSSRALVAYIDQTLPDPAKPPEIVPIRFATILAAPQYGRTYVVHIRLEEFCRISDLKAFNDEVRTGSNVVPVWTGDKAVGKYWLQMSEPTAVVPDENLVNFEDTAKVLARHQDFMGEALFYHIIGIRSVSEGGAVVARAGEYMLDANHNYELEVFHFSPKPQAEVRLVFESGTSSLILTSNSTLFISSRYDLKKVSLRALNPPPPQGELPDIVDSDSQRSTAHTGSIISVFRLAKGQDPKEREWQIDLPVRIRPDLQAVTAFGVVLGLALSAPAIVAIWGNDKTPTGGKVAFTAIVLIAYLVLGVFAAHGLRKPTP